MSLSKRNFCYSILISLIFVALVAGYFTFMLPSLYADYIRKDNIESVATLHNGFVEKRSYENLEVKNPTSCFSIELPLEGNDITVTGKFYQLTISVKQEQLLEPLDTFRDRLQNWQEGLEDWEEFVRPEEEADWHNQDVEKFFEIVLAGFQTQDSPIELKLKLPQVKDFIYDGAKSKVHFWGDGIFVLENTIADSENQYTSYIALQQLEDRLVFTILPAVTPKMDEITPIVFSSLPMIGAVVLLLVLLFSQIYSKGIVAPIIRLADYAQSMKNRNISDIQPFLIKRKDEIGMLSAELNEMYQKLMDNYQELEMKNQLLEDENKRQEVFLRASSHQLKTPVAAALLLIEGMMGNVGKYKDRDEYLPRVKAQLLSMRKMIEDILSINHEVESIPVQEVKIKELVEDILGRFRVQITNKELRLVQMGEGGCVPLKKELFEKILDNLIANAVLYTPHGEKIEVRMEADMVQIQNYGCQIPEDILPHIYEPFVSSERTEKGHGLGLYIVAYYARLSGCKVEIQNAENSVLTQLVFAAQEQ